MRSAPREGHLATMCEQQQACRPEQRQGRACRASSPQTPGSGQCMVCSPTEHLPLSRPTGCGPQEVLGDRLPRDLSSIRGQEVFVCRVSTPGLSHTVPGHTLRYPASAPCAGHGPCGVHGPGYGGARPDRGHQGQSALCRASSRRSRAFAVCRRNRSCFSKARPYGPATRASTVATAFFNF